MAPQLTAASCGMLSVRVLHTLNTLNRMRLATTNSHTISCQQFLPQHPFLTRRRSTTSLCCDALHTLQVRKPNKMHVFTTCHTINTGISVVIWHFHCINAANAFVTRCCCMPQAAHFYTFAYSSSRIVASVFHIHAYYNRRVLAALLQPTTTTKITADEW